MLLSSSILRCSADGPEARIELNEALALDLPVQAVACGGERIGTHPCTRFRIGEQRIDGLRYRYRIKRIHNLPDIVLA
jgi:hypothetical protein